MRVAVGALILSLLSAPAFPQAPAPVPAPAGSSASLSDKRVMDRVEQRIKDLHGRLGITPAQQPQWDAFTAVMRQNAQAMEANHRERQANLSGPTALDKMRNYAALSRLHADNVDRLLPAFEALYNTMSADQRATTDRTFQSFQLGAARSGRS